MINFQEIITDSHILAKRYIERNGFYFTAITYPGNIYDAIIIKNPSTTQCSSTFLGPSVHDLEKQIEFINEYKIEKALLIVENIDFILLCPSLKYLRIIPSDAIKDGFDYSPLYEMPQIKSLQCLTVYGSSEQFSTDIDCSRINGLEDIHITNSKFKNFNQVKTLRSLGISNYGSGDLREAFNSLEIDTLSLFQCKIKSLDGIQKSHKMQCVYLYQNRSLRDISSLKDVKNTLKALRIDNCSKINDFSVLCELENLELLELSGSNEIPNLSFLKRLKKLKTFIFSMNITDGDLSNCVNLSYAYSEKNRKHYNLKDSELPKNIYVHGNESIESWRRLE